MFSTRSSGTENNTYVIIIHTKRDTVDVIKLNTNIPATNHVGLQFFLPGTPALDAGYTGATSTEEAGWFEVGILCHRSHSSDRPAIIKGSQIQDPTLLHL